MSERGEALVAGYLDGSLSEAEQAELLQALQSDSEFARRFAEEVEIHRALQIANLRSDEGDRRAADRILHYVRASGEGARFAEGVRHRALRTNRRTAPLGVAVAAGLVVGILLIVTLSSSDQPASTSKRSEEPRRKLESPGKPREVQDAPASRERTRREAEERLEEIEREQQRLARERQKAAEDPQQDDRLRKVDEEFARTQAALKAAQEALARAREDERRAKEAPPSPVPAPGPSKSETQTILSLATLERVEGQVTVLAASQRIPATVGRGLLPGEGLETKGAASRAVLKFPDGTQIELGGGCALRELRDREGAEETGKWMELSGRGFLAAQVTKQPQGRALVIATPHGEARVVGTTLRIVVDLSSTRLEVTEGHVRLSRKGDAKTVEVLTGQYAVAAAGAGEPELVTRPLPPDVLTINFGPDGLKLPEGALNDSGEEYDPKRGFGWKGPKQGPDVIQPYIDPNTGKPLVWKSGRNTGFYEKGQPPNLLRSSYLAAGSVVHTETWVMPLPNGRYFVSVCVGGTQYKQGPHHVSIEGLQIINRGFTRAADHLEVMEAPVEIKDGELTMIVGGSGGKPPDPSTDTILNYIVIRKAKAK